MLTEPGSSLPPKLCRWPLDGDLASPAPVLGTGGQHEPGEAEDPCCPSVWGSSRRL